MASPPVEVETKVQSGIELIIIIIIIIIVLALLALRPTLVQTPNGLSSLRCASDNKVDNGNSRRLYAAVIIFR